MQNSRDGSNPHGQHGPRRAGWAVCFCQIGRLRFRTHQLPVFCRYSEVSKATQEYTGMSYTGMSCTTSAGVTHQVSFRC
jgi:hypothetical protein